MFVSINRYFKLAAVAFRLEGTSEQVDNYSKF